MPRRATSRPLSINAAPTEPPEPPGRDTRLQALCKEKPTPHSCGSYVPAGWRITSRSRRPETQIRDALEISTTPTQYAGCVGWTPLATRTATAHV